MTRKRNWEIHFTSKWSGEKEVHEYTRTGSRANADGWLKTLAKEHGCRATLVTPEGKAVAMLDESGD